MGREGKEGTGGIEGRIEKLAWAASASWGSLKGCK
jgi:hypothetical protein